MAVDNFDPVALWSEAEGLAAKQSLALEFQSPTKAKAFRLRLYAARRAMREALMDTDLAAKWDHLEIICQGSYLTIRPKDTGLINVSIQNDNRKQDN